MVENGQTTFAKGFGFRKLGSPERVDADTIFLTGSTGKAFTTAALATLVDQGKLKWDDKVADHLPGFQMYDPYVTREMTVRDLLVHRSGLGLGQGDLMYIPRGGVMSRAEIVRRVRYLKPATSFRSGYAYDNILYTVAGALIEAVSGQSWESYVREHVLRAAGMTRSTTDEARLSDPNRALPHGRTGGIVRGTGAQATLRDDDQVSQASAPAGLIAISANDMAAWLKLQLAHGVLPDGKRVFSEATAKEMWTPQTIEPITAQPPGFEALQPNFSTYALGWEVRDYAGHKLIMHGGGLWGFISTVVLIPEKNVGFAIEMNSEDSAIRAGLMWELIDHYLDRPRQDWPAKYDTFLKTRIAGAEAAVRAETAKPIKAGPSLALARYSGTFADPWYGNIVISPTATGLAIDFTSTPRMKGRLEHYQYDTFITRFDDPALEPAYVTFALGADGGIERISMKPVSPIADFSYDYQDLLFTPVAAK
ncbi:serine hydrolase [Sphingomonas antarctica]|uniref:serine hydrolase n=1 Tax=Sphingomonas antarctica TaxID=2040274 RepID=UPI0039EBC6EE